MKFYEITVTTGSENTDIVSDILYEITGQGVVIKDKENLLEGSWDYVDENIAHSFPEEGAEVKGFVMPENLDRALTELKTALNQAGLSGLKITTQLLDDEGWQDEWKKNYFPVPVGDVIICPAWLDDGNSKNVLIDTGLAFGTGQHETTKLCLALLQETTVKGNTVLDIGCGSGVLGLAAVKLGAKQAVLVDNDEQAADTARENVVLNSMQEYCTVIHGDLTSKVKEKFDIVLANLTAPILTRLAGEIEQVVKKGTVVILGGILTQYAEEVKNAYKNFALTKQTELGEWTALMYEVI